MCHKTSKEKTTNGDKRMDGRKILMCTLNKQAGVMASGMDYISTGDNVVFFAGVIENVTGLFSSARNFCGCKHKLLKKG
jgi:hypothetical protein